MIPLLVDLEREWRGGQHQFLLLLKGLYERGHAAELLTAKGSSLGHRASKAGYCVHYTGRGSLRIPAAWKVRGLLGDGRFDLVHVNESHALTAAWMARAHREVPLLVARRVGYPLGRGYFSRARFAAAARIIANSKWVAEQAVGSGASLEKVAVIYEGAEIPKSFGEAERRASRAKWGRDESGRLLGCAGVLLKDKGQGWVIRAFYRAIDVFVFPVLFEGLGTSLLAAMAHAVPSVTYYACALGEIVENGASGLQVEPKKPQALAEAIA